MCPAGVFSTGLAILRNEILRQQNLSLEHLGGAMLPAWRVAPEGMAILRK
jgi:hypothetical protein